jgi:hypothetical protein
MTYMPTAQVIVEGCPQATRANTCSYGVFVLVRIPRSRFTDTITIY